jgi:hypothetical protein
VPDVALSFPNLSRSYDAAGRRVRFWGYDDAIEIAFFVEESALLQVDPKTVDIEAAVLQTFDAALDQIREVACKLHSFNKRRFHVLVAGDFR